MVPTGTAPKPDGKVEFGMYTGTACCLEKQFIYEETSTLGAKSLGKSLGDVVQVQARVGVQVQCGVLDGA